MNEAVTMGELMKFAGMIIGAWGFYKVIMEIINRITARHDREKSWDEMADKINSSRENIIMKYDSKLAEMEKKIDENHADTEARLQQFSAELYMQTITLNAVLDGLIQMNCNGKVTEAKHRLEKYITSQAYGVKE